MERPADRVFDRDDMLERLGGDDELMREVLALFLEECPAMLDAVRRAVGERDPLQAQHAAHTLKGALLNIAAAPAAEHAREIEDRAREGRLEGMADMVSDLEGVLGRLQDELELIAPLADG